MQTNLIPFTAGEYKKMQDRLAFLTSLRVEVVERLRVAREMGDLSENGAYRYAKFELGNIGRETRKLNYLLENGAVAEKRSDGTIGFGTRVTLQQGKVVSEYLLVSEHESNPAQDKLSLQSPLGLALQHKKIGDLVTVQTPRGETQYLLVSIS